MVYDPDIWWHLRTGGWIVQHHALPHADPFSSFRSGYPWVAYSWLFELLTWKLFQRFGLVGIMIYSAGMVTVITAALYRMVSRLQRDFSISALLTFAACYGMTGLFTPRPWLFTILFFVFEIDILMQVRKTGQHRELLWLPLIFALWANVHIQFIDGLVVLGLAVGESILARFRAGIPTRARAGWLFGVSLGCAAATLINPYSWQIYKVAYELASQHGVLNKISELQALPFRTYSDYCVLLLALGAAAVLGRSKDFLPFESGLLLFAVLISFRSQRDLWCVAIASAAILASGVTGKRDNELVLSFTAAPLVAAATAVVLFAGFRVLHVANDHLGSVLAENLPVRAVELVKEKGYSGPLFNDYTWGGYLIWALPIPVSIDGRAALHGDEHIDRSVAVWNGEPNWNTGEELSSANLVIGPVKAPLTQLLRTDSQFQLAYEDKIAAVFVRRGTSQ